MSRVGLARDDYIKYILLQLGSSVLEIEASEDVGNVVDIAFTELKGYITDAETITIPYSNVIDVSDLNVNNIIYIMRDRNATSPGGLQDIMYIYSRLGSLGSKYTMSDYARSMLVQANKSAISTDLDFNFDKRNDKLYVYAQQPYPNNITLVYTREYTNVSEIIEPYWQNLLKRLSLALMKEVLGRIRGKYTLNSATYSLDADKLLAEAQAELTEIRTYLNNNSDMLLPID